MGVSKADLLKKFAPWKACVEFESKLKPLFIAKLLGWPPVARVYILGLFLDILTYLNSTLNVITNL